MAINEILSPQTEAEFLMLAALKRQRLYFTRTFCTLACQNVYNISLVQQCVCCDSINATARIVCDIGSAKMTLRSAKKAITSVDKCRTPLEAGKHQSVMLAKYVN